MTTDFTVIIPARYASSRLPGKIIEPLDGKPMVQRVYEQAQQSRAREVVIAADDERIADALKPFGSRVVMTAKDHESGTDRLEEVTRQLQLDDTAIVVNVQGDEPLIPPAVIDQVAANLAANSGTGVATLSEPIGSVRELFDPAAVKVVADIDGTALYFSRAPIPWPRDDINRFGLSSNQSPDNQLSGTVASIDTEQYQRHIGIYAYRVALLRAFVQWPQAPLETIEKLEQLRVLFNGEKIHVAAACDKVPTGVDTETDLQRVRLSLKKQLENR